MSIVITERSLLPTRRDGQVGTGSSTIVGGGGSSGGESVPASHNLLTGLQGGDTDEYYHWDATEYAARVLKTGTPVANQIAIWHDDSTLKGDSRLTFDGNELVIATATSHQIRIVQPGIRLIDFGIEGGGDFVFTDYGSATITIDTAGTIKFDTIVQHTDFVSGFAGDKWRISGGGAAEFESLVVRGTLKAYEFVIDKIRASNGSIWVSDSMKIDSIDDLSSGGEYVCYFDEDGGNIICAFVVDDIVRCQVWTGVGIKYYTAKVIAVDTDNFTIDLIDADSSSVPESGDVLVRIGNETDTDRQGVIYLTASDSNAPYIDILDGVVDETLSDKIKVRLGKLDGVTDAYVGALSGYGLWSDNVYLTGTIALPSAGMTDEDGSSSAVDPIRIWAGVSYADRETAPFRVTEDGSLTATGIAELGTDTTEYDGKASNIAIRNADIWENGYNGDSSAIHVNRIGYLGGITKYRDFRVYDGKGVNIFAVQGSLGITYTVNLRCTTAAVFDGTFEVDGASTFDGTAEFNNTTQFDGNATFNENIYGIKKLALGSSSPNTYACVDFSAGKRDGTNPGAFILPIMTTTQRNALTETQGMMLYNSTTGLIDLCTAAGWRYLQTAEY